MRRRTRTGWILPVALALLSAGCPGPATILHTAREEPGLDQRVLRMANAHRQSAGLPPLARMSALDRIAEGHTRDMVRMGRIAHRGSDNGTLEQRFNRSSVQWFEIGENVARNKGFDDPVAEAVRGWMNSPDHCANILNGRFTATGIAVITSNETGYSYFTQVFMRDVPEK